MGDKSRPVFLMIGGGYLIYTGSRLISEVMKSHPTSENLFIAFGAFFVIFGVLIIGFNLKKLYDLTKGEKNSDVVVEDIEFPEAIEEPPVQNARTAKRQIKMVNLEPDETLEDEAEKKDIFDDEDTDDEFIETDDDELYDDEEYYEDDEHEDDDKDEDDDEYQADDEEAESESDEDLFKIKLERI